MKLIENLLLITASLAISIPLQAQWTEVSPAFNLIYSDISIVSADTAYLLAIEDRSDYPRVLCETVDGGRHWQRRPVAVPHNAKPFTVHQLSFTAGRYGFIFESDEPDNRPLLRTTDGGLSWEEYKLPGWGEDETQVSAIEFFDDRRGVLHSRARGVGGYMRLTDDGGHSWSERIPVPARLYDLHLQPDGHGWGYTRNSYVTAYETFDFGLHWSALHVDEMQANWPLYRQRTGEENQYYFSETLGYTSEKRFLGTSTGAGLYKNNILLTRDGGGTWTQEPLVAMNTFLDQIMMKDGYTWAVFYDRVYKRPFDLPGPPQTPVPKFTLQITPNPVAAGDWVRVSEPTHLVGFVDIRVLELASGKEVSREYGYMPGDRYLLPAPHVPAGTYLVQLYFAGDLHAVGKLIIR